MKTIALIPTVFVLTAAGALAQQSDIEFLRARADAHERKISQLEKELNRLKAYHADKQHPKAVPVPAASDSTSGEYVVKKGDMLGRIAKRHNVTVAALKKANGLRSDRINIGQKLRIPGAKQTTVASTQSTPREMPTKPLKAAGKHVVKSGETFYSIARQHNVSVASLMAANPRVKPTTMRIGQSLMIDSSARPAASQKAKTRGVARKPKSMPKESTKVAEHIDPPKPKPTRKAKTKEVVRNAPADRKPASTPVRSKEPEIRTITVHKQITYGQFASKYGASTSQLNELNGLSLSKNTMLAIGSELYVPKD